MKSPYRIAKELNVSPQAVYKRLTNEFNNRFNNHIQRIKSGKRVHIRLDPVAEEALKALYNQVHQPVEQLYIEPIEHPLLNQLNTENSFLKARIELLENELATERKHSREQSDKLSDLAGQLAELTRNNQILLGTEQSKTSATLLADNEATETKGFFAKLFRKNRRPQIDV